MEPRTFRGTTSATDMLKRWMPHLRMRDIAQTLEVDASKPEAEKENKADLSYTDRVGVSCTSFLSVAVSWFT